MRPPGSPGARRRLATLGAFALLLAAPLPLAIATITAAAVIRAGIAAARRVRQRGLERQTITDPGTIVLGRDHGGRLVSLPGGALSAHGLILGATGAGKTTTLLTVLDNRIRQGRPVVAIDLKGSPDFAGRVAAAAAAAQRPFVLWSPDGPSHWNPLATGNPTELKDKLIATERFTEPHYQRAAERYLQLAVQVLQASGGPPVTLSRVVELLDPARLSAATRELPRGRAEQVRGYVDSLTSDQLSAVRGLASRLALLTESHTGRFLEPARGPAPTVDLGQALAGAQVVVFSLNSSTYGRLAGQLGTLAVQDLVSAAGRRLSQGAQHGSPGQDALVAIDEFSALASDNVIALLARGREAGVGVLLATQELADLDRAAPGLRDQVLGNTAVKIAHRQDVPGSALAVSRLAGQLRGWERSYHQQPGLLGARTTRISVREADRYAVEPEQVRSLQTGEAVVIVKSPRASTRVARIVPPGMESRPAGRDAGRQPPAPGVTR